MAKASTVQTRTRCVRLGRPWVGELWGREFPLGGVVASWGCFRGCVLFDFPVAYVVVCAIIGVRRLVDGRWF